MSGNDYVQHEKRQVIAGNPKADMPTVNVSINVQQPAGTIIPNARLNESTLRESDRQYQDINTRTIPSTDTTRTNYSNEERFTDRTSDTSNQDRQKLEDVKDKVQEKFEDVKDKAKDTYYQGKENLDVKDRTKDTYYQKENLDVNDITKDTHYYAGKVNLDVEKPKDIYYHPAREVNLNLDVHEQPKDIYSHPAQEINLDLNKEKTTYNVEDMKNKGKEILEDVKGKTTETYYQGKEKLQDLTEKGKQQFETVKEKTTETYYQGKEKLQDLTEKGKEKIEDLAEKGKEKIEEGKVKLEESMSMASLLESARCCLEDFMNPGLSIEKQIPIRILSNAFALVFLTEYKGSFGIGSSMGTGLIIARKANNQGWTGPCSIAMGGLSIGFQAGLQKIEHIIVLHDAKVLKAFASKGQFKLGGDISFAIGPLGRDAQLLINVDKNHAPVYSYSMSKGLHLGASLDGQIIVIRDECNENYYGKKVSAKEILLGNVDALSNDNMYSSLVKLIEEYTQKQVQLSQDILINEKINNQTTWEKSQKTDFNEINIKHEDINKNKEMLVENVSWEKQTPIISEFNIKHETTEKKPLDTHANLRSENLFLKNEQNIFPKYEENIFPKREENILPKREETTLKNEDIWPKYEENLLSTNKNILPKPEENTWSKQENTWSKPENTLTENTWSKPESTLKTENTWAKQENTWSKPENTWSKPENTWSKPENTWSKPENTLKTENIWTKPEENLFSKNENIIPKREEKSNLFFDSNKEYLRNAKKESMNMDRLLIHARYNLEYFMNPQLAVEKQIPVTLLNNACGLLFLTEFKGGLGIGGSTGAGFIITRKPFEDIYSQPCAIGMGGISLGFQIGGQKTEHILIFRDEQVLKTFISKGELNFGGDMSFAVGPLGRDVDVPINTIDKGYAAIYSYSIANGAYVGLTMERQSLKILDDWNENYFGQKVTANDILFANYVQPLSMSQHNSYESLIRLLKEYIKNKGILITNNTHWDELERKEEEYWKIDNTSFERKPLVTFEQKPLGTSFETKPFTSFEQKPLDTSFEHKPLVTSFEQKPLGTVLEPKPLGTSFENKPLDTSFENKLLGTSFEQKPLDTSFERKPLDASSNLESTDLDLHINEKEDVSMLRLLRHACHVFERFVSPNLAIEKRIPTKILCGAAAIIFLTEIKAGLVFGASVGKGFIIARRKDTDAWTGPCAITLGGMSLGWLVGAEKTDHMLVLRDSDVLQTFLSKGQLKFGGDVSFAVGPLGRDASVALGVNDKGYSPLYAYAISKGVYMGATLDGHFISIRDDVNEQYYGTKIKAIDILHGFVESPKDDYYRTLCDLLTKYVTNCEDNTTF